MSERPILHTLPETAPQTVPALLSTAWQRARSTGPIDPAAVRAAVDALYAVTHHQPPTMMMTTSCRPP